MINHALVWKADVGKMGLVGPWLSTTSTKKKTEKITKKKQEELERGWKERNVRLKEMHLPKETFEQYLEWIYGKGTKKKEKEKSSPWIAPSYETEGKRLPKVHEVPAQEAQLLKVKENQEALEYQKWTKGPCSSKPSPVYTGTKMIGIAQMHKSNAVPVFTDEEVKDISKMRR